MSHGTAINVSCFFVCFILLHLRYQHKIIAGNLRELAEFKSLTPNAHIYGISSVLPFSYKNTTYMPRPKRSSNNRTKQTFPLNNFN